MNNPVIIYQDLSVKSNHKFLATFFVLFFLFTLTSQINWVKEAYATVSTSVISAPITTPVVTPTPTSSSSQSSSSSSNNDQTPPSPVCNDQKPQSAPVLVSVKQTSANQVTLTWTKAKDPVSYYLVSYGDSSKANQYGNPKAGDKNTTSVVIKNLSGNKTYFFKVAAVNNCQPGDFSNVLSVKVTGKTINISAEGFKEGVLGASSYAINPHATAQPSFNPVIVEPYKPSIFEKIFNFFSNLFKR